MKMFIYTIMISLMVNVKAVGAVTGDHTGFSANRFILSNSNFLKTYVSLDSSVIHWLEVPIKARNYIYNNYKGAHILIYKAIDSPGEGRQFAIKLNYNGDIYNLKFNSKGDLTRMKMVTPDENEVILSHSLK